MSSGPRPARRDVLFGLVLGLLSTLWAALPARGAAVGSSTGTLDFEITSASLPANLTLNPGGTTPSNFLFPDSTNSGAGSLIGLGSAGCTPAGCTSPAPGVDFEVQLSTDLTCTSNPDGTYGGLEDSFALFGARNTAGGPLALDLRFTASWSISASVTDPAEESASASIFIVWAVPTQFCIELTSCASGSLSGGTTSASCPAGAVLGPALILANSSVDTGMGNDSDTGPSSTCDVQITVLAGANGGGDLGVTSDCSSMSGCPLLSLSDDTITGNVTKEACRIEASTNYQVVGPNGNLTLRAGQEIQLGDGFSVGIDGTLTLEIDPSLLP